MIIHESIEIQARFSLAGVSVAFSYNLEPSRIDSVTKCRLAPTKSYNIFVQDTQYISKNQVLRMIYNAFHSLQMAFSWTPEGSNKHGQYEVIADPITNIAFIGVIFINSSESEWNIKSTEYLCGYCDSLTFSARRNENNKSVFIWIDDMAHKHRHHSWEIRPNQIQATLMKIQQRKMFDPNFSLNVDIFQSLRLQATV